MSLNPEITAEELAKDRRPCSSLKYDLKECLKLTDCIRLKKKSARECLLSGDVPEYCESLRYTYFECRRSLLDNRTRFRGRKGT